MTAGLEFRVLGEFEVFHGDRRIAITAGKVRVVLAALLLQVNRTVTVDQLIDRLWGEAPPGGARTTAQAYVMRLRRALGDGLVHTRPSGYQIELDPDQLDLTRFRALVDQGKLRDALSLWRGEALTGVPSESLRRAEVPQLAEEHLRVLERRVELDLELGRHSEVVAELSALTNEHPLREGFWRQLMLALFRSGRQAEAVRTYQEIRDLLIEELGVEPGPDLRRLHEAILSNELRYDQTNVPRQLPADVTSFVARQQELATLDSGTVMVIHGMAGVGKTALAVHWAHRAMDRFPDGQLYLDLGGFDPSRPPMDPSEALGQCLHALGVTPERMPDDLHERAGLYRSLLADKQILVVADNAATVDQVRPLLPGTSPSLTLVTSRNELTGLIAVNGAHNISIDVLTPVEAMALLESVLGRAGRS